MHAATPLRQRKNLANNTFPTESSLSIGNAKAIRPDRNVRRAPSELFVDTTGQEEVNTLKLSARNVLKGKVKSLQHGAVNSEVIVQIPGGIEIVSIITKTAAQNLHLNEGKEVYAIVKATNVILGTD
jgi:molybdopterin-binding protein